MRKLKWLANSFLMAFLLPALVFAQNKTVSGRITDANGNPIQGASVDIK